LPELRGEFIRGWDNSRGMDPARVFGSAQGGAVQTHTHPFELSGVDVGGARAADSSGSVTYTSTTLTNTAPSGADETRPRNVALMFCIKT
ncbi:MAG: phage tail protein, partial [Caldilineaceae bacterium]